VASKSLREQMQEILNRLGITLTVVWTPNSNKPIHGEIKQNILYVYDEQQSDALATFIHEVIEFKLKEMTKVYRELVNSLIGGYEKLAYQEKEKFIEFIPKLLEAQNLKEKAKHRQEIP
jgi:alcohol dehydrogenase class IV